MYTKVHCEPEAQKNSFRKPKDKESVMKILGIENKLR